MPPLGATMTGEPLSVVTTCDPDLGAFANLLRALDSWGHNSGLSVELIVVNDLAIPGVEALLRSLAPRLSSTLLEVAVAQGQLSAVLSGIRASPHRKVLTIDPDMFAAVRDIPVFLDKLDRGNEVVFGWRIRRRDASPLRRLASRMFNFLLRRIAGVHVHDFNCPMVLLSGRAVDVLRSHPGTPLAAKFALFAHFPERLSEVPIRSESAHPKQSTYGWLELHVLCRAILREARSFRQAERVLARRDRSGRGW